MYSQPKKRIVLGTDKKIYMQYGGGSLLGMCQGGFEGYIMCIKKSGIRNI